MRTLARAISHPEAVGRQIRLPWKSLSQIVALHTKELVVIAGAPSGGKSTVAINLAMNVDYPVLYFAQDNPSSVLARMVAVGQKMKVRDAFAELNQEDKRRSLSAALERMRPTLLIQERASNIELIEGNIIALKEWLGGPPAMMILDNTIDTLVPGYTHMDNGFYATLLPELKQMAIRHDLAVVVLHHVTRGRRDRDDQHAMGRGQMTMNDLLFAGEREARHVWGVYNDGYGTINVQILKQQDGPADPEGLMEVPLRWYPEIGVVNSI
jgi:hypothetical protein